MNHQKRQAAQFFEPSLQVPPSSCRSNPSGTPCFLAFEQHWDAFFLCMAHYRQNPPLLPVKLHLSWVLINLMKTDGTIRNLICSVCHLSFKPHLLFQHMAFLKDWNTEPVENRLANLIIISFLCKTGIHNLKFPN